MMTHFGIFVLENGIQIKSLNLIFCIPLSTTNKMQRFIIFFITACALHQWWATFFRSGPKKNWWAI